MRFVFSTIYASFYRCTLFVHSFYFNRTFLDECSGKNKFRFEWTKNWSENANQLRRFPSWSVYFLLTSKELHKSSSIFLINRLNYLSIHAIIAFSAVALLNNTVVELIVQTKSFLQVNEHRKASFHIRSLCSRSTLPRHRVRGRWKEILHFTAKLAKKQNGKAKRNFTPCLSVKYS